MTFSLHDSIEPNGACDGIDSSPYFGASASEPIREAFHILREKLRVPETRGFVERPRITSLLKKSLARFPATMITGRSGTGKTAVAALFADEIENVSWYTIESPDIEWPVFARYFTACLSENVYGHPARNRRAADGREASEAEIARFLINRFSRAYAGAGTGPSLIVLDDIHHIFDAPWFEDFFNLLLYSLPPDTHLFMLCRSKPPGPLWRLRSKQMLNLMDERVIAFDQTEAETLFNALGRPLSKAKEAQLRSFGRVSKLLEFAREQPHSRPFSMSARSIL